MAHVKAGRARCVTPLLALALAACSQPAVPPPAPLAPGEWRTFSGTWSAVGERHSLRFGPDRRISVASLSGTLLVTGEQGLGVGFQGRILAFSDEKTGGVGRAVWTDDRGDQVFSELTGGTVARGHRVAGTIVGGTGRWAGLAGSYDLEWQSVMEAEEGMIQVRTVDLKGRVRFGQPATPPAGGTTP